MIISVELLKEAITIYGLDEVYEKLSKLFYEDFLIFVDKEDNIFKPLDTEDLYDFLELLAD